MHSAIDSKRAAIQRWTRETAEHCARTNAVYALAEAAPTFEAGMAIIAEHSAELLAEHLAKTGLCPAAA